MVVARPAALTCPFVQLRSELCVGAFAQVGAPRRPMSLLARPLIGLVTALSLAVSPVLGTNCRYCPILLGIRYRGAAPARRRPRLLAGAAAACFAAIPGAGTATIRCRRLPAAADRSRLQEFSAAMSDQRNLIIAIALSVGIILAFQFFYEMPRHRREAQQRRRRSRPS